MADGTAKEKIQIKDRWDDSRVLFECEVSADLPSWGLKLGAAIKLAIKALANLARADLAGADLAGADLAGADLARVTGCVLLTDTDHGFRLIALMRGDQWRIYAGCRDFSIAEARAHWGASSYHTPPSGRRVVACLDWLEMEIANGLVLGGGK